MAKTSLPRPKARKPAKGHIWHSPRRGLMISTQARFPQSADDKVVVAKSIVQAVIAAHDAGPMEGENYDIHWPLRMAVDLLEQASDQLGVSHGR
jgi:hypothetical protein